MNNRNFFIVPLLALTAACTQRGDLNDPAYGGFFNGIENIAENKVRCLVEFRLGGDQGTFCGI